MAPVPHFTVGFVLLHHNVGDAVNGGEGEGDRGSHNGAPSSVVISSWTNARKSLRVIAAAHWARARVNASRRQPRRNGRSPRSPPHHVSPHPRQVKMSSYQRPAWHCTNRRRRPQLGQYRTRRHAATVPPQIITSLMPTMCAVLQVCTVTGGSYPGCEVGVCNELHSRHLRFEPDKRLSRRSAISCPVVPFPAVSTPPGCCVHPR